MSLLDILISASCGAAVVGSAWAYSGWKQRLAVFDALDERKAEILKDKLAYPNMKAFTDLVCAQAKKAQKAHKRSKHLFEVAERARNYQLLCEKNLRAAGINPADLLGEVA